MMMPAYERAKALSEEKLGNLRAKLPGVVPDGCIVLTYGSYARREASNESDLDFVTVYDGDEAGKRAAEAASQICDALAAVVPIEPSAGGAFGGLMDAADLFQNLGGMNDTNETITRRILLLLEGDWISGEDKFRQLRRSLIERYVTATPPKDHQLALFLLNDIIRYWRTMTVDYAFKVTEGGKDWGLRNIKLMYSRKLMYAGGLFAVAMTADRTQERKIEVLEELFNIPSLERIAYIAGEVQSHRLLEMYDFFLNELESKATRLLLKGLKPEDKEDPKFRELKNEGHRFTRELLNLFQKTFHSTHLIHRAVIF